MAALQIVLLYLVLLVVLNGILGVGARGIRLRVGLSVALARCRRGFATLLARSHDE